MKRVTIERFRRDCLKILAEMSSSAEPVVITKRGKPIAKLVRPDAQTSDDIFGCMRGKVKIVGDIVSPAIPLRLGVFEIEGTEALVSMIYLEPPTGISSRFSACEGEKPSRQPARTPALRLWGQRSNLRITTQMTIPITMIMMYKA